VRENGERGREPAMQARGETGGGDAAHTLHAPGPSQQLESAIRAIPRHSAAVGRGAEAGREGEAAACISLFGGARPALRHADGCCASAWQPALSTRPPPFQGLSRWRGWWTLERSGCGGGSRPLSPWQDGRAADFGGREKTEGEGGRQHTPDGSQLSPPPLHPHPPPSSGSFNYGGGNPMRPHRVRLTHSLVENYDLPKMLKV